jgi:DNA-binding GntR family transcriptional regulator
MINEYQHVKEEIMVSVSGASEHRLRPYELERSISHRLAVRMQTVRQAVKDLVEEGKLAYTYRDPTSYIEPAEGIRH